MAFRRSLCAAFFVTASFQPLFASAQTAPDASNIGKPSNNNDANNNGLGEIVVTARKKSESMQNAPIAITAIGNEALEARGIKGLGDFVSAPSPFLQISPYAGSGLLPIIGIRGLATDDPGQGSNESAVGIYLDGVYLGRAQGATMEFGDIAQVEILRGPQGTLFGRNALGGAISLVSKKPTGVLGLEQTVEYGSYNQIRSLTHLNLPTIGNLKLKGDFLVSQRDGWVHNPDPHYPDFGAYRRIGGRVAANLELTDRLTADYVFDLSIDKATPGYMQRTTPNGLTPAPVEPDRVLQAQVPVPLQYSRTKTSGHALTLTYSGSSAFTAKSISAYREMTYSNNDIYPNIYLYIPTGPNSALSGLSSPQSDQQHQFSQELQFTGDLRKTWVGRLNYAAGLYYFSEKVNSQIQMATTAYTYGAGNITTPSLATIAVPEVLLFDPASRSVINSKSYAGYAQISVIPPIAGDSIEFTGGIRYTHDDKTGQQLMFDNMPSNASFTLKSNSFDHNLSLSWSPARDVHLYVRHATGYRAGGVSLRDPGFVPFAPDNTASWEAGFKSEFWEHRARFNVAAFSTAFHGMRTSFSDPANPAVTRLFNAKDTTRIKGVEVELTLKPVSGLVLTGSYSHLATRVPPQANPFNPAILESFTLAQAPANSGSLAADWTVGHVAGLGSLILHGDAYFTSAVVSVPQLVGTGTPYELYNARLTLNDIPLASGLRGKASLWVQNLADAHYRPWEMAWAGAASTSRLVQFGTPRTVGGSVTLQF